MADLLLKVYNSYYATGSKAFTETLRAMIGRRGSTQFKYFSSFTKAEPNSIDVLICDEAHRIWDTSNNRWTRKEDRSDIKLVEEISGPQKCLYFSSMICRLSGQMKLDLSLILKNLQKNIIAKFSNMN